jgi:hypothetical protein
MDRKNVNRGIPEENNHAPKPVYIKLVYNFSNINNQQKLHKIESKKNNQLMIPCLDDLPVKPEAVPLQRMPTGSNSISSCMV